MYRNGWGVSQDYKEAVRWYRLAAEQDYAIAQFNLGAMYENGEGVPQNYKEAVRLYTLAAEQGHAKAQSNLGVMYRNGEGVFAEFVTAHMWFKIAANNGNELAAENREKLEKRMTFRRHKQWLEFVCAATMKNVYTNPTCPQYP